MSDIEEQTRAIQGSKHLPELQAFRGLAALVVLVHHCSFYYQISPRMHSLSDYIFNAHAAVVSFFVLSGFVLSRSLGRMAVTWKIAANFYIKRLFRIYPGLFFASLLGLAYLILFHHRPLPVMVAAGWAQSQRDLVITVPRVVAGFLGLGNAMSIAAWSLFGELVGSLLLPGIVILFARGRFAALMVITALLVISLKYGEQSRLAAGVYLVDFAFGASIPFFQRLFRRLTGTSRKAQVFGLIAFLFLMTVRLSARADSATSYHTPVAANFEAIAAMILIGIIATRPSAFPLLSYRWTVWIGDISYSLYLLHIPVLAFVAGIGGEILKIQLFTQSAALATISLLSCTLLITIPLASWSYKYIEIPGVKLGKRFVR